MAKVITAKLTKNYISEQIKVTGERQTFRDATCHGLILRVGANGRMSWAYDYRDPKCNRQTYTIGTVDTFDPGQARLMVEKVRGTDPAGQKRETKAEAEAAVTRTVRAFAESQYWKDYLIHAKSGRDTQKRILAAWEPLLDTDMEALDVEDARQHRAERLVDEVSPQTLNRDRAALLGMLNKALEWKVIGKNPIDDPSFKPLKTEDDKRVRWLGQLDEHEDIKDEDGRKLGERQRFMAALKNSETPKYLRQITLLALNTGLRRGELFKLRWENVSIQRAELTVRANTAKSNKNRHIALNVAAVAVLEELAKVKHISGYVFVNAETEKPYTTLKKSWATLVELARLNDITFHDTRHDFASRLVQAGVNLYEVKELLGHSSITLTERYAHLAPHQSRAAVALLNAA